MERKYLAIIMGFSLSISTFIVIFVLHFLSGPGLGEQLIPPEYITEFIVIIPGPIFTDILLIYLIPLRKTGFYGSFNKGFPNLHLIQEEYYIYSKT